MDPRFLEKDYAETMPADWFEESPRELVPKQILADIERFWGHESAADDPWSGRREGVLEDSHQQ
jgi:hypothetical protein